MPDHPHRIATAAGGLARPFARRVSLAVSLAMSLAVSLAMSLAVSLALPFALSMLLALAGPTAARAASLRVASAFDPATMDPHSVVLLYQTRVVFRIYEGLVGRDEHYQLQPALAVSWAPVGPLTWRFHLRPGVRFQDGSPFTADDVVFSIGRALAPPSHRAYNLTGVTGARAVDPLTVDLQLSAPDAVLPEKLTLVAMMSRRWCEAHGASRAQDYDARQEAYTARHANGTGPYALVSYEPDERTVLRANPSWWGRKAGAAGNVDRLTFTTIRSDATRVAALDAGEVDVVLDPPDQDVAHLARDPRFALVHATEPGTQYLAFDLAHATLPDVDGGRRGHDNPFRDPRVRRAVYHAVNVDLLIEKALRGQGVATGALFGPTVAGTLPEFERRLRYDPVRARALLAEAGWPDGFDVPFECVGIPDRARVCQAIAVMLNQVGIRAHLHTSPPARFFSLVTQGRAPLIEYGWAATSDAWADLNGLLHTWTPDGGGTFNAGRYSNPGLDRLIDDIRTERDLTRRRALVTTALRIAREDVPYVPLYRHVTTWVMRRGLRHVVILPDETLPAERVVVASPAR